MPASTDEELVTYDRTVATAQKAASASLCLVAAGMAVLTAVHAIWVFTGVFLVGLAMAVQSYRVVEDQSPAF